ncbi:MAG: O-antigen ligase family protein [Bacteroidetes bacterium]|nr:O-antigen ligase family protein [Bacteroidota bacterium]
MKINNLKKYIPTINLALILFGYAFITTIFIPNSYDDNSVIITRYVTLPLRLFILLVNLYVLVKNYERDKGFNKYIILLFIFFLLYLTVAVVYISVLETTVERVYYNKNDYYFFIIGVTIIPFLSVLYSYKKININMFYDIVIPMLFIALIISVYSNQSLTKSVDLSNIRQQGNKGLSTIEYGHMGVSFILISLYRGMNNKGQKIHKIFNIAGIMLGGYIMLKAGSRSPIISLLIAISAIALNQNKKISINIFVIIVMFVGLFLFYDDIVRFIGIISPIMEKRINLLEQGDLNMRDVLLNDAIKEFISSPLMGNDIVLHEGRSAGWYPHNIFIESFMVLGVFGGLIITILTVVTIMYSLYLLKYDKENSGLYGVLFLQQLVFSGVSGALHTSAVYFTLMVLILMNGSYLKKKTKQLISNLTY